MSGYLGSKAVSGAYQQIIARMPPHDTYIETHLGGGAVILRKPLALNNIGVDIDNQTLNDFAVKNTLGNIDLVNQDAVDYLNGFDFSTAGKVHIYCDPPYLLETRTSRKRYRHEYTEGDHIRLIKTLKTLPATIMLSGYPSALYDSLLSDWRSFEFQVMTRGGVRTEKIWMNYEETAAYSPAFAGINATDRQRIKRKAERWAKNYRLLPPAERLAVMSELVKVDN
ncbi:DNA adenine methylase [Pragia fontium]|uniref:site-specific DNA-methyltransferase (adenine-specific) n=1 Tax=Pragia fontium DSM 5563 = ATCC 49100 TaxID=1122977 RepID=A0AAJ5BGN0_9GAMM|nr:DNA adenine methylase [Pragia fontium]SFC49116.1 hypothetical protein SAMN02745723_102496 [Pragia fontium DSM 5563 = ATCC 49100]